MRSKITLTNKFLGIETDRRFDRSVDFISRKHKVVLKNYGGVNRLLGDRVWSPFESVEWGSTFAIRTGEYVLVRYHKGSIADHPRHYDLFGVGSTGKILRVNQMRLLCPSDEEVRRFAQKDPRYRLFAHIDVLRTKRKKKVSGNKKLRIAKIDWKTLRREHGKTS